MSNYSNIVDYTQQELIQLKGELVSDQREVEEWVANIDVAVQKLQDLVNQGIYSKDEILSKVESFKELADRAVNVLEKQTAAIESATTELAEQWQEKYNLLENNVKENFNSAKNVVGTFNAEKENFMADASQLVRKVEGSADNIADILSRFEQHKDRAYQIYSEKLQQNVSHLKDQHENGNSSSQQQFTQISDIYSTQELSHFDQNLTQTVQQFGDNLSSQWELLKTKTQETLRVFDDTQQQRWQSLGQTTKQTIQSISQMSGNVTDLTRKGSESVGTVVDGMQAVNVGFDVSIGILENVQRILEEIADAF